MTYTVRLERRAERELRDLPLEILRRVDNCLQSLSDESVPRGAIKLKGRESQGWRIRVGDYRILYTVDETNKLIKVYRIAHRREAYR